MGTACHPVGQDTGSTRGFHPWLQHVELSEEMTENKRVHEEWTGAVMGRINKAELPTMGGCLPPPCSLWQGTEMSWGLQQ